MSDQNIGGDSQKFSSDLNQWQKEIVDLKENLKEVCEDRDLIQKAKFRAEEKLTAERERSAKLLGALNIRSERSLDVGKLEEIILIQKAQYDLEFENARGWRESLIPLEKRIATAIATGDVWEEGK